MCAETWTHTRLIFRWVLTFFFFFGDTHTHTHKQSDTFWSCALITSSRLIVEQRWTGLTTDYWLAQLVTVISRRVIWHWPCCSQTAANPAALEVIVQLFTTETSRRGRMQENSIIDLRVHIRRQTAVCVLDGLSLVWNYIHTTLRLWKFTWLIMLLPTLLAVIVW